MTYEDLVRSFGLDNKYATYLAKRFLSPMSLDEIAISEGLPPGIYHRLFTDFPEYEQKFKNAVEAEDESSKELFLRQSSTNALIKLSEIINDTGPMDKKDLIQACRAILGYRPNLKKPESKTPLDSIFKDLVDSEDGT